MARPSREAELIEFLETHGMGSTWAEMLPVFPAKTLQRLLKALKNKGVVEKTPIPRVEGQLGRTASLYSLRYITRKVVVVKPSGEWLKPPFTYQRMGVDVMRFTSEEKREYAEAVKRARSPPIQTPSPNKPTPEIRRELENAVKEAEKTGV